MFEIAKKFLDIDKFSNSQVVEFSPWFRSWIDKEVDTGFLPIGVENKLASNISPSEMKMYYTDSFDISPQVVVAKSDYVEYYSETYWLGDRWSRTGVIIYQDDNTDNVVGNSGSVTQISKLRMERYAASNHGYLRDLAWAAYSIKNVRVTARVGSGFTWRRYMWNSNAHYSLGVSASTDISIGFTFPNTPISMGITLEPAAKLARSDFRYVDHVRGKYPLEIQMNYSGELRDETHYFYFDGLMGKVAGASNLDKRLQFRWNFDIYEKNEWGFYNSLIKKSGTVITSGFK